MKNTKKVFIILTLLMTVFTIYQIVNTYALFESRLSGTSQIPVGRWNIDLNGSDITSGVTQNFLIDSFNIEQNEYISENKIAPGLSGYFEIEIHPKDTQVSIRYDITIDNSNVAEQRIKLVSVTETNNTNKIIRTGPNTYTAIIPLENINTTYFDIVKTAFVWENNEEYNEQDTAIGTKYNPSIAIPIAFTATQYTGEEIIEYVEGEA